MPWWWYVVTGAGSACGALIGGWFWARYEARVKAQWEAVGLRRGSPWPSIIGQSIVFAVVGFTITNFVAMFWM